MIYLLEKIQGNWTHNKHTAAAYLDVKGVFDNINYNTLIRTLKTRGVPSYLTTWISSFLVNRKLWLKFDRKTSIPYNNNFSAL
jgi:hypothetical protein